MANYVKLTTVDSLADPGKSHIALDDRMVVLFKVDGKFYCLDDVCTHDGGPLGEGRLDDHTIACPRHGAQFDIRSGAALTMPATQATRTYEVKIEDGTVYARVDD